MVLPVPRSAQPPIPERVGRYELLLPIASGGMATVYLGRVTTGFDFEREVAVKLVHAHLRSEEFDHDLIEEARLAGRIRHPNVVPVLDVGADVAGVYLVMEYIEGDALSGLMRAMRSGLGVRTGVALRILCDALQGLHAAHQLRDAEGRPVELVHRDFSPQNILVGLDGICRLADFGIAKAATRLSHTSTGVVKGKFGYMPPEQALGEALDRRADVWAAGVIAWEILARKRMHESSNDPGVLLSIVMHEPPRLRDVAADVPSALEDAVRGALTKDLKHRFPTALAFAHALAEACERGGLDLAGPEEVAQEVSRVAGQRIDERRTAAAEMIKLRRSMAVLTAKAQEPTPSPVRYPGQTPVGTGSPGESDTVREPAIGRGAEAPTQTDAVSVSNLDTRVVRRRARKRILVAGSMAALGGAGLAAIVAWTTTRETRVESVEAVSVPASAADTGEVLEAAPALPAEPLPNATVAATVAAATATGSSSAPRIAPIRVTKAKAAEVPTASSAAPSDGRGKNPWLVDSASTGKGK